MSTPDRKPIGERAPDSAAASEPPIGDSKSAIRKILRQRLSAITPEAQHAKSLAACALVAATPEFAAARVVMLYLSMPQEVDASPLALRAWQSGKTVLVPKVSWNQRRMLPVEISSLHTELTTTGPGVLEPIAGKPVPVEFIDLAIVPGLGFTRDGYRIGRGMGFYDRFLAQSDFIGISCGLAFAEQIMDELPVLDHDMQVSMLATDQAMLRFTNRVIVGSG
jgi:5-formyltetrahydrofolate cyclo-ligase